MIKNLQTKIEFQWSILIEFAYQLALSLWWQYFLLYFLYIYFQEHLGGTAPSYMIIHGTRSFYETHWISPYALSKVIVIFLEIIMLKIVSSDWNKFDDTRGCFDFETLVLSSLRFTVNVVFLIKALVDTSRRGSEHFFVN